jgi:hypothetical protein
VITPTIATVTSSHDELADDLAGGSARECGAHRERDRRQQKRQHAHLQQPDVELTKRLQIVQE